MSALRLPARTAAIAGMTLGMYPFFEAAIAMADSRDAVREAWVRRWSRLTLPLVGVDARAVGPHLDAGSSYPARDASGRGRIFVMNHRSALDIVLSFAFFDAAIVSRADLGAWPVLGPLARRVGTIFVDRESRVSGAAVISAMRTALVRGSAVMVYPEGTTYPDDEVRPFKPGGFLAARRAGAEVVPAGVAYADPEAAFVDETFLAHVRRVAARPKTRVALVAGQPIVDPGGTPAEFAEAGRVAVQGLVREARTLL